eukprot:328386_1
MIMAAVIYRIPVEPLHLLLHCLCTAKHSLIYPKLIYITGQNEEEVYAWDSNNKTHTDVFLDEYELRSPCRMYIEFDKDVELTFDSAKIHSMKDWFPDACEQTWRWDYLFRR